MNTKKLQKVSIKKDQLNQIKGGYVYVPGAVEGAGFVGTSVDIRLLGEKGNVYRNTNRPSGLNLSFTLR